MCWLIFVTPHQESSTVSGISSDITKIAWNKVEKHETSKRESHVKDVKRTYVKMWSTMRKLQTGDSGEMLQSPGQRNEMTWESKKGNDRKNIGKHGRILDYIIQVQDVTNKEMNETPTGVSRSRWDSTGLNRRWLEKVGKGLDQRYLEMVLEPNGSNTLTSTETWEG